MKDILKAIINLAWLKMMIGCIKHLAWKQVNE
jgi:hypothetical protein